MPAAPSRNLMPGGVSETTGTVLATVSLAGHFDAALVEQVAKVCSGQGPTEVRCVGGAARSDLLLQLKAPALKIPTVALDCPEPTSRGAALLAPGR